jgi:hypothetical protein
MHFENSNNNNNNNNNSIRVYLRADFTAKRSIIIQFFVIYVQSQQLQGQLQTQHSADTSNYIMGKHNIKSKSS